MFYSIRLLLVSIVLLSLISCGRAPHNVGSGDPAAQAECRFVDTNLLKQKVFLNVPYTQQEPNYCGPASLEMIFKYYGKDLDQLIIGEDMVGPKGVGSGQLAQKALDMGFNVVNQYCGISSLLEALDTGIPVIVRVLNNFGDNGHFMVVVGYDIRRKKIYLNDPADPQNTDIRFDDFEDIWNITTLDSNNSSYFMMVITPEV